MTIQVELSPEAEARLTAEAQAHGISLEKYAGSLLWDVLASPPGASGKLTVDELYTMLREIAEGIGEAAKAADIGLHS